MKVKLVDIKIEEDVESETGTCEFCFGSQVADEETLELLVTHKDGKEKTVYINNFYYTDWDNYFDTVVYIDNYPKFSQWLLGKIFPEDTVIDTDWLVNIGEDYYEENGRPEDAY